MYTHYEDDLIKNDSIRALTRPADSERELLAKRIAGEVAKDLEDRLTKAGSQDDFRQGVSFEDIQKWTTTKGTFAGSEKAMYRSIHQARMSLASPSQNVDYKPEDSDDSTRIDIGLVASKHDAAIELCVKPSYYRLRAVVEAKKGKGEGDLRYAFAQLCEYTRQMYAVQHNLRTVFGFTVCADDIRIYHFGHSKIVASEPMDVTSPNGRRAFVELLVNMSLCDDSQLGRDPTMQYLPELRCWQIDCPDSSDDGSSSGVVSPYYFSNIICIADHLLGRHTRCFPATADRPARKLERGESIMATVVIKDAFALAKRNASEDDRDEVKTLKKIRDTFKREKPNGILYPKIVGGGRVSFNRGGQPIEDTTSAIYEGANDELLAIVSSDSLFRAHRRIVMKTIGEPLRTVRTVKEFVAVIYDAMKCHYTVVKLCKILHRDISDNNILVVRMKDGTVRGLLIDFDCAIDISKDKEGVRGEMTGTRPFMSLNNLLRSNVTRTSLDDWESMLYLLCWYATIGFGTNGDRPNEQELTKEQKLIKEQERLEQLPIARWRKGTLVAITREKLAHLRTLKNFKLEIVLGFDRKPDHCVELGRLAISLYKALFENGSLGEEYYGTEIKTYTSANSDDPFAAELMDDQQQPTLAGEDNSNIANPFAMRAEKWEQISDDLLGIIEKAKNDMVDWKDTP
ncbi:hypothetical protein GGI16_000101 [Coemansia sp. S142-1]|nr:hypothetical protein GGI16_000101 [Coemansia sp. S142-1]